MALNFRKWLEEATAQVNPFDKGKTAATVRAARANPAPVAQTIRRQPNTFTNNPLTRGASRAVDQVNPFDNGRTWKQRTPVNTQSLGQQVQQTARNTGNLVKQAVIQPTIDATQRAVNTTSALSANVIGLQGGLTARALGNKQLSDRLLQAGSDASDKLLTSGWGNKGGYMSPAQAASSGQGLNGVRETFVKPVARGVADVAPIVTPLGAVGRTGNLARRAATTAGANAGIGAGTDAAAQYAETGRVDLNHVGKSALISGAVGGAIPVAGAGARAVGRNVQPAIQAARELDQRAFTPAGMQPTTGLVQGGYAKVPGSSDNLADIQNQGSRPPVQQQLEDAHNAGDMQSVRQIIDSMPDSDPYKPAMQSVFRGDIEQTRIPANAEQRLFEQNPMLPENQPPLIGRDAGQAQPKLPEFSTKKTPWYDKAARSTRSIIERQGPSGQQLAGMLRSARDTEELFQADIARRIPTVLKLKGKRYENFVEATQGKEAPRDAMVAKAVEEWRATHPQIRDRAVKAGLDVGDLGETYYPHFIDYDKIFKDKNTFNTAINHLVQTGQARTPEEAIQALNYARDVSRDRKFGNLETERLLDLPMYDKTRDSLVSYLQGSSRRIAQTETFGARDEKALELIKKAALEGADTEAMKNAYDVAVGAKKYNPTTSKASRVVRQYNTTTKLGLGALTNTAQNVNTGVVTGHLRTLIAAGKKFTPEQKEFVQKTGVIADAVINDIREMGGGFVGKVLGKITAPGFGMVEKFNRSVAAVAGRDYANSLARKGKVEALRKLGVTGNIGRELTEAQQIQAARRVVEKTQFKVDPQDLPGWVDSPWGKVVAQFRTFSYNQGKFFSNEVLKPLFKKGNAMPLARVIAALPAGYLLVGARGELTNRIPEENPNRRALEAFGAIGGAGLGVDAARVFFPMNGKYVPADRRIAMATSLIGGPSAGTVTDVIGGVSEAVQRKNVPDDGLATNKLGILQGENSEGDEQYTDATSLARTGMRQIPIVGGRLQNSFLPYKEREDATSNADNFKRGLGDFFGTLAKPFTGEVSADTGEKPENIQQAIKKANKKTKEDKKSFEKSFSKDDLELYKLNKSERESLVNDGVVPQEKFDQLDKYADSVKKKQGKDIGSKNVSIKDDQRGSDLINDLGDKSKEERDAWRTSGSFDNKYKDIYDRAQKIRFEGLPDLPQSNEVLDMYAELLQKNEKGMTELDRNNAKLDFLKGAYKTQVPKESQELFKASASEIVDGVDRGAITADQVKKAVEFDDLMLSTGLSKKADIQKEVRLKLGFGLAPNRSGKSSGSKKSSGRKKKVRKTTNNFKLYSYGNPIQYNSRLRNLVKGASLRG